MGSQVDLRKFSILPIVDLSEITTPRSGAFLDSCKFCSAHFSRNDVCKNHYAKLLESGSIGAFSPCPYGFSSYKFDIDSHLYAFTSIIPFPREGIEGESLKAKQYPQHKLSRATVVRTAHELRALNKRIYDQIDEILLDQSVALHEIRKLNAKVKVTAERLCMSDDSADHILIFKTSEMMSSQFSILELMANNTIAQLSPTITSNLYQAIDKCVRIYQTPELRIKLSSPPNYTVQIKACDKTFLIIPTVLIENALKYADPGSDINIRLEPYNGKCKFTISNIATINSATTNSIFERGYRAREDKDGTGNGLFVAQMIAKQHNTAITMKIHPIDGDGKGVVCFTILFDIAK